MPKRIMRILTGFIVALLLMTPMASLADQQLQSEQMGQQTEQRQTIRVAFPTQQGMSFLGHSGNVTGYNYDYLEKISEYTGWEMEYVQYSGANNNEAVSSAIDDLTNGKVDLMGPLLKNAATEEMFEFPQNSYGTVYTTLCALSTSSLREHNLYNRDVLRIGLWSQAETRNSEVMDFIQSENINCDIKYYDTFDEQKQALFDGDVDAITSVSLSPISNTRIIAQFAPRPYYFAAPKGSTEIIEKLDAAMELIDHVDPNLQDALYNNYFRTVNNTFLLSDEQKETLANMGKLNVLCASNAAPFAYNQSGKPHGMIVTILEDFAVQTGLELEYTFCSDREEARNLISQKHYDIFIGVPLTSGMCSEYGFINSAAAFESTLAYVQYPTASEKTTRRIALVKGVEEQIPTDGYDEVILCDNSLSCINALEAGRADIGVGSRSVMEYYIYETASPLVTSHIPGQSQDVVVSVSRDCDMALLGAVNNYIYSLSETDLATYLSEGNLHPSAFSLFNFMRRYPVQSTLIIVALVAIIAAIIIVMLMRAAKSRAEMQASHNTQLQEALQIAREANEAKTTFLSNMSHDIRTPMNAVIGFSTLLAREPDNSVKVREYTRKIGAASNHLLGLINDILDISKIESGKFSLRQSVFSIDDLMESINVVIRPMTGEKKQIFTVNMGKMTHELFVGDKVRINQVLINLLSNAIKYTPAEGHILFNVTDLGTSPSSSLENIEFIVSDNGYGITEEFQKIIFEPFTRAESSTVNKEVGTGLGLAITKNIVDLMGGTIDLQSKPGKGSTFTVRLPLRLPHEEADEHFWENHNISRVLIVDDDKSVCDGVKANMADTGVEFDEAHSGEDAVDIVKREYAAGREYSAIILDWQMPGMNGLDAAREIRKIIPIDTPVLFLTSYDWTSIETEALEIDVDGFLAKPFTSINLKEKLIEVEHFKNAVSKAEEKIELKGLRFLLAEDNQLNAEIITELLIAEGASCDMTENGQEVVDKFISMPMGSYDAILMDVMMPVMNGYEATKAIRSSKHPEALTIPIIAMTANAFVKDVQDALDAGMNAHLAKPINMDTLKNTLASCIKH